MFSMKTTIRIQQELAVARLEIVVALATSFVGNEMEDSEPGICSAQPWWSKDLHLPVHLATKD